MLISQDGLVQEGPSAQQGLLRLQQSQEPDTRCPGVVRPNLESREATKSEHINKRISF